MPYFTYPPTPLIKLLMVVLSVWSFLAASSCNGDASEQKQVYKWHPMWFACNEPEDEPHLQKKDKCVFTKAGLGNLGLGILRFYAPNRQKCFNKTNLCLKSDKNIIQIECKESDENSQKQHLKTLNYVLTPNFFGRVTDERFPKTVQEGMQYIDFDDDQNRGLPLSFLEELLAIDPIDHKEAVFIFGIGLYGKLGVSKALKNKLKEKKQKGDLQDYYITKTSLALTLHNQHVNEGKKVFTFIHLPG